MVIPRFVNAALKGEPLRVHGDGNQSRCFLHVRDAIDAILRLERTPDATGHIFNVGSTESVTILELANRVLATAAERYELPQEIMFVPYDEAYPDGGYEDIRSRQPDISKIWSFARWRPTLTLDDVLRDVVAVQEAALATASVEEETPVPVLEVGTRTPLLT
jgi:UDP-glucose 4-epimerase